MLTTLAILATLTPQDPGKPLADETRQLPTLDRAIRDQRFLTNSGRIVRRTTDAATGATVDAEALLREEARVRDAQNGKMSHELVARLAELEPSATLRVVFWLRPTGAQPDVRAILDAGIAAGRSAEDARRTALAAAENATHRLTKPFVEQLKGEGLEPAYVDAYIPLVFVDLTAGSVAPLALLQEVDQAYYSFPTWMTEEGIDIPTVFLPNEWASPSARTDYVHRKGINGAGVKVMVNDPSSMVGSHPNLPPVISGNGSGSSNHATAVAGIICSDHDPHTGAAPGLTDIYNYGASGDTGAPMAWSWAMNQGVSFGNCSWWNGNRGSIVFLDRYFDYIIRNFGVMMFKSCGNQGNGNPTTTPCNGFNMTASGCATDNNSHDWNDDSMASFSSTGNPQPSNQEKPEVTAHGSGIWSTDNNGGVSSRGSGTSYASPVTCGTAALLAQTDTTLQARPEAVKALLMAGAWNNIHGGAPLSDYDGAGGIDAAASQSAVEEGQYVSTTLDSNSFSGGIWSQSIPLDAGDETRIVALWFSNANQAATVDVLEMDLDMVVRDPSGTVVASSASAANSFEIVSFVPAVSGAYTVEMQQIRFQGTSEPFALAWTTSWNARTNEVSLSGTPMPGSTVMFDFYDRYHPNEIYQALLSATPYPATFVAPNDKLIRMGFDVFSSASMQLPGFVGLLDGNGRASANLSIPNLPLQGVTFYAAMVTFDAGVVVVEETSDVLPITIQ